MDRPGVRIKRVSLSEEIYRRIGREAIVAGVLTVPFLQFGLGLAWLFLPLLAVTYLVSCQIWIMRPCGRCEREKVLDDGRGNGRPRNCKKCQNEGYRLRWGARLFGKGRAHLQRKKY